MDSLKYFELLDDWTNRYHRATKRVRRSMIPEYWEKVDKATLSKIEISLIMSNK